MSAPLRCPTCRATWRGVSVCPRCGTDLGPLMRVAARAWDSARRRARRSPPAAEQEACDLAAAALRLHATPGGGACRSSRSWPPAAPPRRARWPRSSPFPRAAQDDTIQDA